MKILIVDDEVNICLTLKNILEDENYTVKYLLNGDNILKIINEFQPNVIMLDVKLDNENGLDILKSLIENNYFIPVIMISGHSGITDAVNAMKIGAFDFLEKPFSLPKIKLTVKKAIDYYNLKYQFTELQNSMKEHYKIIGNSSEINKVLNIVEKVSKTDSKVLIRGESGTGKELIAYAIHSNSKREYFPFIKFNSAAIPNDLVESELFGFEKGAFTGAVKTKKGKLESADNGTLFLDEIGDMSLSAQAKILRVIQEGEFERIGSNITRKINTRIIAATHKNLEEMVENGLFRKDLFYRLNVVPIINPPLRNRVSDIPILIKHFSLLIASELKIKPKIFPDNIIKEIQSWLFPGNIRELKNLIERIHILSDNSIITKEDLPFSKQNNDNSNFWYITKTLSEKKIEFEKKYLQIQLKLFDENISKTADALGLFQGNLSRKLKNLGIQPKQEEK